MEEGINIMSHKIMEMDEQKRERIINAAMLEFCNGYKKASTDVIVREAGISKGLLFHYFGTKEKLYGFLHDYALDVIVNEFFGLVNFNQPDLLDRIWQTTLLKMDLSYKHPAIFDFVAAGYSKAKDDPNDRFFARYKTARDDLMASMLGDVDASLFREGVDVRKAVNIIWWTLTGYAESQFNVNKVMEDYRREYGRYLEEIKEYFDVFRELFYK